MRFPSGLAAASLAAWLAVCTPSPAAGAPPAPGGLAPDFALKSTQAQTLRLSALRGRVVVLNFFATWCPPCRAETPDLVAAERRFARKGVTFVGVDDRESAPLVSVFARMKGIRFPLVLDSDGAVGRRYDVRAIPTTYVLDRNGVIRFRRVAQLDAGTLSAALDAVTSGAPLPESALAKRFEQIASGAASTVVRANRAARAALSAGRPADAAAAAAAAIRAGAAADAKLDALQNGEGSSSIDYFSAMPRRDALDAALAAAYRMRAQVRASKADREQAALLDGQVAQDQERFAAALSAFTRAISLEPRDTKAYDGAYLAAYELGDYERAAELARGEAAAAPNDPESWLTLASAQMQLKRYGAALEAERTAFALASTEYLGRKKRADYELGRVWLKTARTYLAARNAVASQPYLVAAQIVTPKSIVGQQADEQYAALGPSPIALALEGRTTAASMAANPAKLYVAVRNPSDQRRTVHLEAAGLPPRWLLSFCYAKVCNPYRSTVTVGPRSSLRIELQVVPLGKNEGPWTASLRPTGAASLDVDIKAGTARAAVKISAV